MKGYCVDRDFSEVPLANVRSAQTHGCKKYFLASDLFRAKIINKKTKNEVDRGAAVESWRRRLLRIPQMCVQLSCA